MKKLIISTIYMLVRNYIVDSGVFDRVRDLVINLINEDIPGDDKKDLVRKAIKKEYNEFSTVLIDTAIQVSLLKYDTPK